MITTIIAIWGCVATAIGIYAGIYAKGLEDRCAELAGDRARKQQEIDRLKDWCELYRRTCADTARSLSRAADELERYRVKSERGKHARAAQIANDRAMLAATTAQLRAEVGR